MSILVVHGSRSGWAERVADLAVGVLRRDGHEVTLAAAQADPDLAGHDVVAVVAGVRAGRWNGEASDWVRAHADALGAVRLGIATVCLQVLDPTKGAAAARAVADPLLAETHLTPAVRVELAGGYDASRVNLPERLLMKAMKTAEGDHVDEAAVTAFARELVA